MEQDFVSQQPWSGRSLVFLLTCFRKDNKIPPPKEKLFDKSYPNLVFGEAVNPLPPPPLADPPLADVFNPLPPPPLLTLTQSFATPTLLENQGGLQPFLFSSNEFGFPTTFYESDPVNLFGEH